MAQPQSHVLVHANVTSSSRAIIIFPLQMVYVLLLTRGGGGEDFYDDIVRVLVPVLVARRTAVLLCTVISDPSYSPQVGLYI